MPDLETSTADGVLTLTLNRPRHRNAVTGPMASAIAAELERAASDDAVRVVLLTGAGGAFSSGADLAGLAGPADDVDFVAVMEGAGSA